MKKKWAIKDIIDLEYFFYADKELPDSDLEKRDRDIFLQNIEGGKDLSSPKQLILKWLSIQRKIHNKSFDTKFPLPGQIYLDTFKIIKIVTIIFGVLSGFSITASFLSYTGKAPVNLSLFLLFFVFLQIIFFLAALIPLFLQFFLKPNKIPHLLYPFISKSLLRIIHLLKKNSLNKLSKEKRTQIEVSLALIRGKRKVYRSIFFAPVFYILQIFGVFFNLGILTATIFKVTFSDLAFGWQTTLKVDAQTISDILGIISIPWSSISQFKDFTPSKDQIEGSQMILKQGIYHLNTADLVSWWQFLVLSVLFYGLLPRLFTSILCVILQKKELKKIKFDTPECERLIDRMRTPLVTTSGLGHEPDLEEIEKKDHKKKYDTKNHSSKKSYLALVPFEIKDIFNLNKLRQITKTKLYGDITSVLFVEHDPDQDIEAISDIINLSKHNKNMNLLFIMEAWHPPINETLDYIKEITSIDGLNKKACIGLIGKPNSFTIFTRASDMEVEVWSNQILKISNPYIYVIRLEDELEV